MFKQLIIFYLAFLFSIGLNAQVRNDWKLFESVDFQETFSEEFQTNLIKPVFSEEILSQEGKEIVLLGYIVSSMESGEDYEGIVFSKYPFENCYFCGGAGPETVAQVEFDPESHTFKLGNAYGFKGTLMLNKTDDAKLTFILKDAELYDF